MLSGSQVSQFIDDHRCILVRVQEALGSTPRKSDAFMLVSESATLGTIGGGQLEYLAIDEAVRLLNGLASGSNQIQTISLALGPEIGQCCGGRVSLSLQIVDDEIFDALMDELAEEEERYPHVYLFGGGHVGFALSQTLSLLPVQVHLVETRADAVALVSDDPRIDTKLLAMPETMIDGASSGAAFVVLTHDHALDFLIVEKALKRHDAAYVGMIGSLTKRASFEGWLRRNSDGASPEISTKNLNCPMAPEHSGDKRPEVLAAFFAAEIMAAFAQYNIPPKTNKRDQNVDLQTH